MLEIYNDECRDLLHPDIPSRDIALREDKEGRMFFTGAREEIVTDKKVDSDSAHIISDIPLLFKLLSLLIIGCSYLVYTFDMYGI